MANFEIAGKVVDARKEKTGDGLIYRRILLREGIGSAFWLSLGGEFPELANGQNVRVCGTIWQQYINDEFRTGLTVHSVEVEPEAQ